MTRRPHALSAARLVRTIPVALSLSLAGAGPVMAAESMVGPGDELAAKLAASGWQASEPAPDRRRVESRVDLPAVSAVTAVRHFAVGAGALPPATLVAGDRRIPLPFAAVPSHFRREDGPEGPLLRWMVGADARMLGATVVASLDAGADAPEAPWSPWSLEPPPPGAPAGSAVRRLAARGRRAHFTWRQDRLRRGGPPASELVDPPADAIEPTLRVRPIADVTTDVLAASFDAGATWLALEVPLPEGSDVPVAQHGLELADLHGVGSGDAARLVAVPRPLGPRSDLITFVVTPHGEVRDLGSPWVPGAPWTQLVSDVRRIQRDGAGGEAWEAVVLVHDLALTPAERTDSWGAVMQRAPDGRWSPVAGFALPGPWPDAAVRFARDQPGILELTRNGRVLGRQAPVRVHATARDQRAGEEWPVDTSMERDPGR